MAHPPTARPGRTRRQTRRTQRALHLVAVPPLLAYVYAPVVTAPLALVTRAVAVPVLVVSGLAMWQTPRLRRLQARRTRAA